MQTVYERCCGIDVHKKLIVACFRNGKKTELRKYDTLTSSIKELAIWLIENGCEMVAMESTGAYWKPIYNILELLCLDVMVVNAHHHCYILRRVINNHRRNPALIRRLSSSPHVPRLRRLLLRFQHA